MGSPLFPAGADGPLALPPRRANLREIKDRGLWDFQRRGGGLARPPPPHVAGLDTQTQVLSSSRRSKKALARYV